MYAGYDRHRHRKICHKYSIWHTKYAGYDMHRHRKMAACFLLPRRSNLTHKADMYGRFI